MAEIEIREISEEKAERKAKHLFQAYHLVYYALWIVEVFLAFRFAFRLFGANQVGFVRFIYQVSGGFMAPFFGIFGTPRIGDAAFEATTLVAMAVYAVIAYAIIRLIRVSTATHEDEVTRKIGAGE